MNNTPNELFFKKKKNLPYSEDYALNLETFFGNRRIDSLKLAWQIA